MAGTETVLVIRPPARGKHGDPVPNAQPQRFESSGWMFAPGASSEIHEGQNSVDTDAAIYGPPDAPILPKDQVVVRGKKYEVVGEPAEWGRFGTVVDLRRFAG